MVLFKILCSFSIKYREFANFFCEDDKHIVHVGEPDIPLATLLRGRRVNPMLRIMIGTDSVSHHQCVYGTLFQTIEKSFYDGKVFVMLKNALFERSSPLRHQAEKEKVVNDWKPIECTYSDGSLDYNTKHYSVKIAQLAHFLNKNLDMSVSTVTYPGGSYTDPAERIMPLLNIAMQGVALARRPMEPVFENALHNMNSMEAVCGVCKNDNALKCCT